MFVCGLLEFIIKDKDFGFTYKIFKAVLSRNLYWLCDLTKITCNFKQHPRNYKFAEGYHNSPQEEIKNTSTSYHRKIKLILKWQFPLQYQIYQLKNAILNQRFT